MKNIKLSALTFIFFCLTPSFSYAQLDGRYQRQYNEEASALYTIKASNTLLYKLRYKYKTMSTPLLLANFQKWMNLYNENKTSKDWVKLKKKYLNVYDLILCDDFDIIFENAREKFYSGVPWPTKNTDLFADRYKPSILELISTGVAEDFFIIAEIDIRLRNKLTPEDWYSYPYGLKHRRDLLNIFSDYGLMVGFIGDDITYHTPAYNYALAKLYKETAEKIIKEGIEEQQERTFTTEDRFVKNLLEQDNIPQEHKNIIKEEIDKIATVKEQDIKDFYSFKPAYLSQEDVISELQKYTELTNSTNLEELSDALLQDLVNSKGMIGDELIVVLFGKNDKGGYYNYLSENLVSEDDICRLILLSALCFEPNNKVLLSRDKIKMVSLTFNNMNKVYTSSILPKYANNELELKGSIKLIKSSALSKPFNIGYKSLSKK